jgi:uncharacterized membrane protein YhaH (DUF805 family)
MIYYVKKVLCDNYANFDGRASRSEYWYYALFNFIVIIAFYILSTIGIFMAASSDDGSAGGAISIISTIAMALWGLGTFIPSLAVAVRRLHDIGKSGWWYFIVLIPCGIGAIWFLILMVTGSDMTENQYGPVPED